MRAPGLAQAPQYVRFVLRICEENDSLIKVSTTNLSEDCSFAWKWPAFFFFFIALLTSFIEMACIFYKALLERLVYNIYIFIKNIYKYIYIYELIRTDLRA
jgi:hypothetical protein